MFVGEKMQPNFILFIAYEKKKKEKENIFFNWPTQMIKNSTN